mmetsp:Transcript_34214/g.89392  ORF Transcript_34214/g.89392 Transcript_34214/m.89392 type:complete len:349 (-) Transcript_34214:56-1102(-)
MLKLGNGHHLTAPLGMLLLETDTLGVFLIWDRLVRHLPLVLGDGLHAVGRSELEIRVRPNAVLLLHRLDQRAVDHLRRADERLEAAVEERQRAVRHLEAPLLLELGVVEHERRRRRLVLQLLDPLKDHVGQPAEVGVIEHALDLLARQALDVRERRAVAVALGRLERRRYACRQVERLEPCGRRPLGVDRVLVGRQLADLLLLLLLPLRLGLLLLLGLGLLLFGVRLRLLGLVIVVGPILLLVLLALLFALRIILDQVPCGSLLAPRSASRYSRLELGLLPLLELGKLRVFLLELLRFFLELLLCLFAALRRLQACRHGPATPAVSPGKPRQSAAFPTRSAARHSQRG